MKNWKYEFEKGKERLWLWLVWKLPRELVYWCAIRLMSHATAGDYSHVVTPEVTVIEALERWH